MPPLAAAAALTVGLGVLKRVTAAGTGNAGTEAPSEPPASELPADTSDAVPALAAGHGNAAPEYGREAAQLFAKELAAGNVPGVRTIRAALHIGQAKAQRIREYLGVLADWVPAGEG